MTYVITQPCVDVLDKACIDECPVDCIYEGDRMLYIHPDECVDCGACEPVCPVEAIYYEDDVPDKWKDFYNANVEFFSDLGSPGGAAKTGKIGKDHPLVAASRRRAKGTDDVTRGARAGGCRTSPGTPWRRRRARAGAHPGGVVDLSIGTPVDRPRRCSGAALAAAGNAPGYPPRSGTAELRAAAAGWLARRLGVEVADPRRDRRWSPPSAPRSWSRCCPTLLGLQGGGTVIIPEVAYPTYEVGRGLAGPAGAPHRRAAGRPPAVRSWSG